MRSTPLVKFLMVLALCCLAGAVYIFGSPIVEGMMSRAASREAIDQFKDLQMVYAAAPEESEASSAEEETVESAVEWLTGKPNVVTEEDAVEGYDYADLLLAAKRYNSQLYNEGQDGRIVDMYSLQEKDFDMTAYGFKDQLFAYITIPDLDVELPVYLGASDENLAKGAARLSNTSLPIGGNNTNSVIAAHSGFANPMFTKIGNLQEGSLIYITNLWGTLTYKVVGKEKIDPTDVEKIMIQDDKDMVTLMTCTPVRVNTYRMLVYCERVEEGDTE